MKIMVVDDSKVMRRIVVNAVEALNPTSIEEAADGMEAYQKLEADTTYDLILTDWNMPVMNGLALVKKIRTNDGLKEAAIIMVTTESEKSNVITAIKAGADNYIVKPFTAEVLLEKVKETLDKLGK
ncbi:response regulator [Candidatus Hydrogenedentota bacterium]